MIVRHLERIKLGTPYSEVAKRVAEIAGHPCFGNVRRRLLVDATGVGAPVVEMLREARPGFPMSCPMTSVIITGGQAAHSAGEREMAPRVDLLATIQAASGKWTASHFARHARDRKAPSGNSLSGSSEHDDLVMAVALAVWGAKTSRMYGFRSEPFPVY